MIWDNGSDDGTASYLDGVTDPRVRVVRHPENIGQNAYPEAFALTNAPYMVELDDDMIDAPPEWDLTLLRAFKALPNMGFLASALVDHPHDTAARLMYHVHTYTEREECGLRLLFGPTGGGCAMTSRGLYEAVGGFQRDRRVFFQEDGTYAGAVMRAGHRAATLADLKLTHAGGPYFSVQPKEKLAYYEAYHKRVMRKAAVKRVILRIPGVAALNRKHGWVKSAEVTASDGDIAWLFLEDAEAHATEDSRARDSHARTV